jgi:hypothetical protein
MSDHKPSYKPNIFSRGSLKLTYDLIRKDNAQLALSVRNIIGGEPLPKTIEEMDNKNSDHFKVELDSFQVRTIVEIIMRQTENDGGMAIMAKSLTQDWVALAR